jgi:2-oxoglutarate dehydrogenase E2 component (dihydrolipoamide succinyltransferase)
MSLDIKVPASGESVTSANIARWHKKSGDPVHKDEVLATYETDKVSNDLVAEADGTLEILVGEGEEVAIGTIIARISMSAAPAGGSAANVAKASAEESPSAPATQPTPVGSSPSSSNSSPNGALIEVKVPASGESVTSANIAAWLKKDGDFVQKDEVLVNIDTDKVSSELVANAAGRLKILVPEGEEVAIGAIIATIDPAGQSAPAAGSEVTKTPATALAEVAATQPLSAAAEPARPRPDLTVLSTPAERPTPDAPVREGRTTRRKMSMLRRKIATHLVNAQQTAAILTTFNEVDMTAVMDLRKQVQEDFVNKHGVKLGFMSFFIKAVVQALKDVPAINGRIEGNDVVENHFFDIGVAVGTEKGLVVPVLRDCERKSFAELEKDILEFAGKAREGKITLEDLQGGVFTISNGGVYGSLLSTPILNPPQSGILGMHTIQQRPVALNGQVVIRPMMYLALSYDHRLVDGKEAVTFLIRIKESLESPTRMLLEM